MDRDISKLGNEQFDLCVIGGGIYGAWVARDAAQRGLSVALIEKSDFASATSANSLKIIHGGFRYLKNADFKRMRESISERKTLMRVAPHLVHPLPVLIPSYGHWTARKSVASAALLANDLISFDRNGLDDPQKHIPRGKILSRQETIDALPGIDQQGLKGSMLFHDAQIQNSERFIISLLRAAEKDGVVAANYVGASGFITSGNRVVGVQVRDVLTDTDFDVRANTVVNTAGPWMDSVLDLLGSDRPVGRVPLEKAFNVVLRRSLFENYAVGVSSKDTYADDVATVDRSNGLYFLSPWRGRTIVGTDYLPFDGNPDDLEISSDEIEKFFSRVNSALPSANLGLDDVSFVLSGILPSSGVSRKTGQRLRASHYQLFDHRRDGIPGLISVMGVKYTTARDVAEKTVNLVFDSLSRNAPRSLSAVVPLYGGDIPQLNKFLASASAHRTFDIGGQTLKRLASTYGTAYTEVLKYMDKSNQGISPPNEEFSVMRAEVLHAVRDEMAQTLGDVVFRRTDVGSLGYPGREVLDFCANVMAEELDWDRNRIRNEIENVERRYPHAEISVTA